MTKAQARAWCRAQLKIIAAWAKEQKLRRLESLKQEVAAKKKRAQEECKRKVEAAKAKPRKKKVRKAAPKKRAAPRKRAVKKRAAARPRKKVAPRPRKSTAKPPKKARKRAPKRKAARKKAKKATSARGAPARIAEKVRDAYAQLRARDGLRNVSVSELRRRSGVTRAQLHAFLQEQLAQRMANPTVGEPTLASPAMLADALHVGREPHFYVELFNVPEGIARRAPARKSKPRASTLSSRIIEAARRLGGGRTNTRVRLKDLRMELEDVQRGELDEELLRLQDSGALVLMRIDMPTDVKHADHTAALMIGGHPRHILYLDGRVVGFGDSSEGDFGSSFRRAFDRFVKKNRRGLVPLSEIRSELPHGRERFDSELRRLRQESDEYALEAFDGGVGGGRIPDAWRDGAIREGGRSYVFVKRRAID